MKGVTKTKHSPLNMASIPLARPGQPAISVAEQGDVFMSREEAADYLWVSPKTLAVWASTKRYPLEMVKIGRLAKYRKSALDLFIAARTVG